MPARQLSLFEDSGGDAEAGPRREGVAPATIDEAKADYAPFDRLVEEDVESRIELANLARDAAAADRDVFITINNKAEGSAPLSVARLAAAIVDRG